MNVTRALSILGFVGLVSLNACHLSKEEYTKIDAWLLCDDCANGERAAVKAIGGKAVHTLDRALIGPSPGRRANMEAQFRQAYRTLPGAPTVPESAYVAELRDNYVALYQRRAAISLADIGDSRALAALRRAQVQVVTRGYRSDVVRVINALLGARAVPVGRSGRHDATPVTTRPPRTRARLPRPRRRLRARSAR